jgi:hypothetical protein
MISAIPASQICGNEAAAFALTGAFCLDNIYEDA